MFSRAWTWAKATVQTFSTSLRTRLVRWLIVRGVALEVEARHGAFRTRHKELWTGGLVRVDIPLPKKAGVTDSPLGEISDHQKLIDSATVARAHPELADMGEEIAKRGAGCLPYLTREQQADRAYRDRRITEDEERRRGLKP